jgi:hypothetical protein
MIAYVLIPLLPLAAFLVIGFYQDHFLAVMHSSVAHLVQQIGQGGGSEGAGMIVRAIGSTP